MSTAPTNQAHHGPILGHGASVAQPAGAASRFLPPDRRPEISKRQLNYAVAAAGSLAAEQAQAEGIDPAASEALLSQPCQIGPVTFAPVSMQTLLAVQMLQRRREKLSSGGHDGNGANTAKAEDEGAEPDLFALAEAVFVFANPLDAAYLLKPSMPVEEFEDRVIEFTGQLLPVHLKAMGKHINQQMELLRELGGEEDSAHPQ